MLVLFWKLECHSEKASLSRGHLSSEEVGCTTPIGECAPNERYRWLLSLLSLSLKCESLWLLCGEQGQLKAKLGLVWFFSVLLHVCIPVPNPLPAPFMGISHTVHLTSLPLFPPFHATTLIPAHVRCTLLTMERWLDVCSPGTYAFEEGEDWHIPQGGRHIYSCISKRHFGLRVL